MAKSKVYFSCRIRKYTYLNKIPGVCNAKEAWDFVAGSLDTIKNKRVTKLTPIMLTLNGTDQMSIIQTRTFFSQEVAEQMKKGG